MDEPSDTIRVRQDSAADIAAIRALHQAAFPAPEEAALVDALRAAGRLRFHSA
jgi:predicted N-acetyltransferase YhbS